MAPGAVPGAGRFAAATVRCPGGAGRPPGRRSTGRNVRTVHGTGFFFERGTEDSFFIRIGTPGRYFAIKGRNRQGRRLREGRRTFAKCCRREECDCEEEGIHQEGRGSRGNGQNGSQTRGGGRVLYDCRSAQTGRTDRPDGIRDVLHHGPQGKVLEKPVDGKCVPRPGEAVSEIPAFGPAEGIRGGKLDFVSGGKSPDCIVPAGSADRPSRAGGPVIPGADAPDRMVPASVK